MSMETKRPGQVPPGAPTDPSEGYEHRDADTQKSAEVWPRVGGGSCRGVVVHEVDVFVFREIATTWTAGFPIRERACSAAGTEVASEASSGSAKLLRRANGETGYLRMGRPGQWNRSHPDRSRH